MATPIKETPVLTGKDAERFNRIIKENETNKVTLKDYLRAKEDMYMGRLSSYDSNNIRKILSRKECEEIKNSYFNEIQPLIKLKSNLTEMAIQKIIIDRDGFMCKYIYSNDVQFQLNEIDKTINDITHKYKHYILSYSDLLNQSISKNKPTPQYLQARKAPPHTKKQRKPVQQARWFLLCHFPFYLLTNINSM